MTKRKIVITVDDNCLHCIHRKRFAFCSIFNVNCETSSVEERGNVKVYPCRECKDAEIKGVKK